MQSRADPKDFPQVEAKILHPLTDPNIPQIGAVAFNDMVPQFVTEALTRYHAFVNSELSDRFAQIETYNRQLTDTKTTLHINEIVRIEARDND